MNLIVAAAAIASLFAVPNMSVHAAEESGALTCSRLVGGISIKYEYRKMVWNAEISHTISQIIIPFDKAASYNSAPNADLRKMAVVFSCDYTRFSCDGEDPPAVFTSLCAGASIVRSRI